MGKQRKIVKCEGRFNQIRNYLYNDAFPIIFEDQQISITPEALKDLWDLSHMDIYGGRFDIMDPYFGSRTDKLRQPPIDKSISLIPLIEGQYTLAPNLVRQYALEMGNNEKVADCLEKVTTKPRDLMRACLGRETKDIHIPGGNLSGYTIAADYGIGTICHGGISGGGIRSDSPFLLEIHKNHYTGEKRGSSDLAAVIGFWPQNNEMLVSQMQSCGNARLPEGDFGVICLRVAETMARLAGFDKIVSYNARGHPIFYEHPENWGQLAKEFVATWDNSAKKLGFSGSRNNHYEKSLK